MRVAAPLVFDVVLRMIDLPDVVVHRGNATEQGARADRSCAFLGQGPDDQRVVGLTRRFDGELLQQRIVDVGKLEQSNIGQYVKHPLQ